MVPQHHIIFQLYFALLQHEFQDERPQLSLCCNMRFKQNFTTLSLPQQTPVLHS
jgi:hypothetical protein